jgi:mannitol-1-phosphate 5-dehydrogenase
MKNAVHFGAGNIGRGFIGAALQDGGYFVTFADVNAAIVDALNKTQGYDLVLLNTERTTTHYTQFEAVNSATDPEKVFAAIAEADVITASVGVGILPRIAPMIHAGLKLRTKATPAVVMACENAVNATDLLREAVLALGPVENVLFANTAVDRIVPIQSDATTADVEVEEFEEWVIETQHLGDLNLGIPAAKLVPDLEPYIERKLYTVNTGHCCIAYVGQLAGFTTISEALGNERVRNLTEAVLKETSTFLIRKFGFDAFEHQAYVKKTLQRLSDPILDDELDRVGRDPLRKLSRTERLIGPAAGLAEQGTKPSALLEVVAAALKFHSEHDAQSLLLHDKLVHLSAEEFATTVCGIAPGHALFADLVAVIAAEQDAPRLNQTA